MVGMLTQGGTSGSCRWCRPGLPADAPLGLYKEEVASCRFTNVQSPVGAACCAEGMRAKQASRYESGSKLPHCKWA